MGNTELKTAFKNALKDQSAKEKLGLTAEILLEDQLVKSVEEFIKEKMGVGAFEKEKAFPETNVQQNENAEDLYKRQLIAELNENYISGFATAESNIEFLKEPSFEKFFTVNSPDTISEYTELQQQKFVILYSLFVEKYKEQQDKKQNFFEYIQKFLEKSDVNQRVQVGLESGFKFSLSLLKEIRSINKDMLVNSLEYLYQTLRFAEPGSLYSTDKLSFMIDSNLNDARSFLVSIIEDSSSVPRAVELAFKIILLLGIVRSNVEDLLIVSTLLDKHNAQVDLRMELELLKDEAENAGGSDSIQKKNFNQRKITRGGTIFYLKAGSYQQEIKQKAAFACDGQHIFMHQEGLGLLKMGTGTSGQMVGQIFQHKSDYKSGEQVALLYLNGKLYCRADSIKPKPFVSINPNTLEEEKEEFELEKEDQNLEWKENEETGRSLTFTPLISDGHYIYVIAQQKAPKKKDENKESEDAENQDQKKEDDKPPMLKVEVYDPTTPSFKLVREIFLYKNEDFEPFIKKSNSQDFIKESSFATNGQVLMIQTQNRAYFFDLKSGVRISKGTLTEGVDHNDCRIVYDYQNNVFYSFKYSQANTRLETFTIANFKKGGASQGFAKDYLSKRIEHFKSIIYGEAQALTDGKKLPPNKLNLIQRIMKNVTTPVLIQHSREESKQLLPANGDAISKLLRTLILRHIEKSCHNFDVKLEEIKSQGKSASEVEEHMMGFFKFPNATYLTHTLFQQIQINLDRTSHLISSKKTLENITDQYSLYFVLKILTANFQALSFCSIALPDLMEEDNYQEFLQSYKQCIVKVIESGYTQDFEEGQITDELKSLWSEIYQLCLNILSTSINLIYADNKDIIANLETSLKDIQNEKQAENSSISLNYLSMPENSKKLLQADSDELKMLTRVFEQCCQIKSQDLINTIKKNPIGSDNKLMASTTLIQASNKFIKGLSEQLIVQYCALSEHLANKQQVSTAQNNERDERDKKRLKDYEILISFFFEHSSTEIINQIRTMNDSLKEVLEGKKDDQWDGINDQYEKFSAFMDQLFQFNSGFFSIITLYVQTFSVFKLRTTLLPAVTQSVNNIVHEISFFYSVLKKFNEKITLEEDKDKVRKFFANFSRNLCWFIGMTAYKLIKVKEVEKDQEKKEKEQTQNEKMQDLIIQSNLLSGGIENRFLTLFSNDAQLQLQDLIKISQDKILLALLKDKTKEQDEDKLVSAIIHEGQNENVDRLIGCLQNFLERKVPFVPYARLTGADGMRLSRAAFGVMIKFSEFFDAFNILVDEVDMQWMDLQSDPDRDIKIKEFIKAQPQYDNIFKRWENASKMRQWINEKKKNLIEKIKKEVETEYTKKKEEEKKKKEEEEEKKKQQEEEEKKKKEEEEAKKKEAEGEQKKPEEKVKEEPKHPEEEKKEDVVQIDTSSKPEGEEQKTDEKPKEEQSGLTEEDKVAIDEIADQKFNAELQSIYSKIIEKAEFLVKLQVPISYLVKDPTKKKEGTLLFIQEVPLRDGKDGETEQPQPEFDWKDRLKSWRQMQTSKGAIKSFTDRKKEIFDSSVMSILACLQTPINTQRIKKQVETVFLNASKRVAGLKLLGELINLELPLKHRYDLISWFCSSLRGNKNQMSHFLDDLKGCGHHLEDLARLHFFDILKGLVKHLKNSNDEAEIKVILNSLKWKFFARDHASLRNLEIFKLLHEGNGKKDNKLKKAWGRPLKQEVVSNENEKKITKEVMDLFEQMFLLTVGRIIKPDTGAQMKLKQKGTSVPALEKAQSVIDENVSEHLIGQAVEVIFREFERYIKIMKMFKGVDWTIYVKMRNKERKNNDSKKEYEDENLLDEEEEEPKAEEKKEGEEKKDGEEKKENAEEEKKAEEEPKPAEDGEKPKEEEKKEGDGSDKKEGEEGEKKEGEEEEQKEEEDLEEKEKQEAIKKQEERAEKEMKSIYKLYSESFLRRLLRLVEIFTSIATVSQYPLSMVQRVANPYQLETLLNLLILSSPRIKIVVLKVIQNLIKIAIPFEVFEETIKIITKDPKSQAYEILHKVVPSVQFEESKFLKFLYNYLLSIRHKMWTKSGIESEGQYAVSQEISHTLRNILETNEKHEDWRRILSTELKTQLLNIEKVSLPEVDVIFSIISGGDFQGLQTGTHALTKDNQYITIIGFSPQWQDPNQMSLLEKDIIKQVNVKMNVSDPTDKIVGLYYDQQAKERQELIKLNLYDVTPIIELDKDNQKMMSQLSLLNDVDVLKRFMDILTESQEKQATFENKLFIKQLVIHILKSLAHMINIGGEHFIKLLQDQGLLDKFVAHLYLRQSKESKSKDIIPIDWQELRCSQIKKAALENDIPLVVNTDEIQAQIMNKKQIILFSNDPETKEKAMVNAQLISAINLHEVPNDIIYSAHLSKDTINFFDEPLQQTTILVKKYGLVFYEGEELMKLDDKAINVLLHSQIVVTTIDIQPKELFTKMVETFKKDDEKPEKERTMVGLLESVILFIKKNDFERIQKPIQIQIKNDFKKAPSIIEGLIKEMQAWAGIDRDTLLYYLGDLKDENYNVLAMKLVKTLKDLSEEKQKNKDKIKKLEVDKKPKELEALKKKIAEQEAKKAKDIEEKLEELKKKGLSCDNLEKSMFDKIIDEAHEKETREKFDEDIEIVDLFSDEKKKEKLQAVIEKKVGQFTPDEVDTETQNKNAQKLAKEFFEFISKIDMRQVPFEYEQTLSTLSQLYSRKTLVNILQHCDLKVLLPVLLHDKRAQKMFTFFLKSTFHEAILVKLSSGSREQLKQLKAIIRNVFEYCEQDPQYSLFLKDFLRFDILQSGINTVHNMFAANGKSIKDYFKTEEKIIQELNPYLLKFMLNLYLKHGSDYLLEKKNYIPNLFNIMFYMILQFQEDRSTIKVKLYSSILSLLNFAEKNLSAVSLNGAMEKLLNNEILKAMVKGVDYDNSSQFNNQQKLLLEIHMKLLDLHNKILEQQIALIDSNLENSEGILKVKRGKTIFLQREKFDFLKYFIHYQNLEDHHKELMHQNIETNHYAYDAKVLAKFSVKQTEKINLKFNERTTLKDFTFVGVGLNANGKGLETYSQDNIKGSDKEFDLFKGDFYLFYPIKKQMVIAFGEGEKDRLGVSSTSNTGPKAAYSTKELKPKRIFASYSHAVIIDSDDNIFRCGYIKKSGNQNNDYQKVNNVSKVKLVACGKFNVTVVTEDNKIYRMGNSVEGHLGINSDYSNMTVYEKIDGEEQIAEKIIDITSGTHFTLFVTENGKLYGIGNRFLKEMGYDCDNKIIPIPLREGVKVLKAYGSMGKKQPLAIIKVQLENGEEQFWSAGRSEQGLLGQGQNVKISKNFKPIKYDSSIIKYVDFSMHSDHAMAIDQDGNLYAWGSNLSKRAGFKDDIFDGVFEPKKVTFHLQENLRPLRVKCGFDHTLIIFEDENKTQKLYSVGADENNFNHLGITQVEASDITVFYREITAFRGFGIVDFVAGHRTSYIIIEGDKEPTDNLYEHKIAPDQTVKGLLHFYKDKESGQIVYLSQEQYESKKDTLPDICFAIKCPIENISSLDFPDLVKATEEMIDTETTETIHQGAVCGLFSNPIDGPRYFAYTKINGDEFKLNLSEKAVLQPNNFDINPLIYYRIKKPLKKGSRLPILDLKKYYKESSAYGLDITLAPQLEFQVNDELIKHTKTLYEELVEALNKWLPEFDNELLKEMDKYVKTNLADKNLSELKAKTDFKINDMTFKNPKLKKLTENIKRKRIELYLTFNQIFIDLMPYISLDEKASAGDISKNFQSVKNMILFSMKNKFIQNMISSLPTGSSGYVEIRRRKAQRFCEAGKVDHTGEHTIFGQIFQQIKKSGFECFRQNSVDQRSWSTKFLGEGSIDAGGPYREGLTNMCTEIESENLPLLIKTVNNRNNHGQNRDCFIPNPSSNNPTHLEMFKFMGLLIGYGIRTLCPIPLHFPPVFWKQILSEPLDLNDLKGFDTYSWQIIEDLKKQSGKLSDEEFNIAVQETFVTRLSDGTEVELIRGGKEKAVTKENLNEYIALLLEKRFQEYNNQLKPIKEGINYVIPVDNLKLFTWEEVETRACGDKVIDIDKLKNITEYYSHSSDHEGYKRFWTVFEGFSEEERTLYLKFVWGRSRLPAECDRLRDRHTLYLCTYRGDKDFPEAHTCFFQLDLPFYTTDEICRTRLITAITMCGEIDADNSAQYIPDDNDVEE